MSRYLRLSIEWIATTDKIGMQLMRVAIAIVFLWIGALKFIPYEADSITPFVANSPFLSFFYKHPDQYRAHLTHEGEFNSTERAWQTVNNTYAFSHGLGSVEIIIGILVVVGLASPRPPPRSAERRCLRVSVPRYARRGRPPRAHRSPSRPRR